jgi:hypothetical protein
VVLAVVHRHVCKGLHSIDLDSMVRLTSQEEVVRDNTDRRPADLGDGH